MKLFTNIMLAASLVGFAACSDSVKTETTQGIGSTPLNLSTPGGAQQQTGSTAKGGVNPAHGQPGHRCDIPVGADLSAPASATTTPAGTTPTPVPTPVTTTPVTTNAVAPGTNPPHGQPGHDCSIAVGAPLNK